MECARTPSVKLDETGVDCHVYQDSLLCLALPLDNHRMAANPGCSSRRWIVIGSCMALLYWMLVDQLVLSGL